MGLDLQSVDRVRRLLQATRRARRKTFSPGEILYCESRGVKRWQSYASRYAAKEATMKALGTGYRGSIRFDQIEILPGRLGRPQVRFRGETRRVFESLGVREGSVSLTGDSTYGCAAVILLTGAEEAAKHAS